jgi:hypothetical protein
MVVVANSILESRGRSRGLDAPQEALGGQECKGVVHGLERDGAYFGANRLCHAVSGDVGLNGHGPHHRQTLGGNLDAVLFQESDFIVISHVDSIDQILE